MAISFSGLASGLDTSSWVQALVAVKQEKVTALQTDLLKIQQKQSTLNSTKSTFNSLRNALEKLTDAKFGGTFNLFSQNIATSSDNEVFTATADSNALRQSYDIVVQQLATYTKAQSRESASSVADDNTKLSNLGVTTGSFTVYVDGVKTSVDISDDYTLGDLKSKLAIAGIKIEVSEDGILSLSAYEEGQEISIGASTDSSNFVSLIGLERQEDGTYTSTSSIFKASIGSKLTAENSGFKEQITAGTFIIGNATFTIDENTTLSSLISEINNSDEAQANAYWDDTTGKLTITSTREGASFINIEAGTSNFTDVMGFTTTERDEDGNVLSSRMYTDTQVLGKNAIISINGTNITSTSNTISSDVSRIQGLTISLKGVNPTDENGDIKKTTLRVEQNSSDLVNAVKDFVNAYNETISKIDSVTAAGADFQHETSLSSFKNTLRNYANSSNTTNGGAFKLLSQLGISTEEASANNLSTDNNKLKLNEDALIKALAEDPESVEAMLAGDNGVFHQMENAVEQMLSSSTGFFDIKTKTLTTESRKMQDKISTQQTKVSTYQKQLEDKFYQMELAISQMQQNYSNFLSQ